MPKQEGSMRGKYLATLAAFFMVLSPATPVLAAWSPSWWLQPTANPRQVSPKRFLPIIGKRTVKKDEQKVIAGWLTPWGDDSFRSFRANLDTLTEVHPFAYTIGADGVSVVPAEGEWHQAEVMALSEQHDIKVIPTIAGDVNHSDLMLNDPQKRTAHITEILNIIEANDYDGFTIDYEGFLNGYNRDVYVAFMAELSAELHERDKIVAIAIEAFNRQQNWEELGKAVDRFMIMGYDYHAARGPEVGPIGPASWLSEVISYATTRVPKEKIILGLGTYGYAWIHDGSQFVSEAVGYQDALQIASETGTSIQRDQEGTPYFSYDRGEGTRHLYFEDAQSTKPKLALADSAGIGGIAFWRLGVEDSKIWDDVDSFRVLARR